MYRGIKTTAILLIFICGIQIVGLLFVMAKMASKTGHGTGLIIIPFIMVGSILPVIGLVSGVGLMSIKPWALKYVLGFSKMSIALYGFGVVLHIFFDSSSRISDVIFFIAYGCTLPLWCLYYLTRPHIESLFTSK
jgi:hypothetical protein